MFTFPFNVKHVVRLVNREDGGTNIRGALDRIMYKGASYTVLYTSINLIHIEAATIVRNIGECQVIGLILKLNSLDTFKGRTLNEKVGRLILAVVEVAAKLQHAKPLTR